MPVLTGLFTLGRDAEIRTAPSGTDVLELNLAMSYYDKTAEGNRGTQWINAVMFGDRGRQLVQYLLKGTKHCITLDDVHIEEYEGKNGRGVKLVGKVLSIELGPKATSAGAPALRPAPRPAPAPAPRGATGFNDVGDGIRPWG